MLWFAPALSLQDGAADRAWAEARRLFALDPQAAAQHATDALEMAPEGATPPALDRQRLAYDLGLALLARGEDRAALALQSALHRRVDAEWSALDLIQTLSRLGESERADGLCEERLRRSPLSPDLWNARALLWLGAAEPERAAPYLGAALRTGAAGTRVTLARLDLARGRRAEARAGFRAHLGEAVGGEWALAGWALTLLPPRTNGPSGSEGPRKPLE